MGKVILCKDTKPQRLFKLSVNNFEEIIVFPLLSFGTIETKLRQNSSPYLISIMNLSSVNSIKVSNAAMLEITIDLTSDLTHDFVSFSECRVFFDYAWYRCFALFSNENR